jgi:hypothetical protein
MIKFNSVIARMVRTVWNHHHFSATASQFDGGELMFQVIIRLMIGTFPKAVINMAAIAQILAAIKR